MRKLLVSISIAFIISCQPGSKDKAVPEVQEYTIAQLYQNEEIYAGGFSPEEDFIIATSNKSGIFNAVALPVVGGEPVLLTKSTQESVFAISYFPDDNRILFSSDSGGNEINHIFVREEELNVRDITPWPGKKSEFFTWARDELSFYFVSNKRDERFFDLYEMDIASFEPKLVYENNEGLDVASISKDKKYLALIKSITTSNNEMYLYEIATGKTTHLSSHEGDATYNPQFFDLSNQYLYYLVHIKKKNKLLNLNQGALFS